MQVRGTLLAALAMCLALACAHAQTEEITDQLIVSFAPDSAPGREVAAIDLAALAEPAGDPRLLEIAASWGKRLGVPLRLDGLTSGRELLLGVDRGALAARVAERLLAREGVVAAEVMQQPGGEARIAVTFEPDSAFAAAAHGEGNTLIEPAAAGQVPVPLTVTEPGRSSAVVAVDADALLSALVERLRADPAVRYVQRNRLLQRYGRARG